MCVFPLCHCLCGELADETCTVCFYKMEVVDFGFCDARAKSDQESLQGLFCAFGFDFFRGGKGGRGKGLGVCSVKGERKPAKRRVKEILYSCIHLFFFTAVQGNLLTLTLCRGAGWGVREAGWRHE